jgi:hypothetical protein
MLSPRAFAIVITFAVAAYTFASEMLVSLILAFIDICVMDGKDQQLVWTIDTYRNELKWRVSYLGICV